MNETLTVYKDKEERSTVKITSVVCNSNPKAKKKKKSKENSSSTKDTVEENLDAILENLDVNSSSEQHFSSKAKGAYTEDHNNAVKQCSVSILQVDQKHLNAENELKRIFGSKVVKSFESSNQVGSCRQIRGIRRGNYTLRKTFLVTPANHWPRWDGSLSMEFLETRGGCNYFRYSLSSSYTQAQRAYEANKAINDINGLASILLNYPYHLHLLLTIAEYFKVVGEHQMSADAIARSLYALECAWHPMFTPLQEVCKLLLALDSDDPMGAIFSIDYFSIRAEEYVWLERFSDGYKSDTSLWLFPNFSYSLAIYRFYLERDASKDTSLDSKKVTSTDLMKQALMLHPPVLQKQVAKVPLKDRVWTNFLKRTIFLSEQTGIPSLDHLVDMYVERSDLHKLLLNAAQLVIETLENNKSDILYWACVRKEAFSSDRNEYGHLLVSEFSDSVASIPPEICKILWSMLPLATLGDGEDGAADYNQLYGHKQEMSPMYRAMPNYWFDYHHIDAGELFGMPIEIYIVH
ncbi:transcription factor 25 [Quillaja saponaria]|uniref:Transcription factor 25 n=1 Tax=Quillaja saponaria TaxID=32244 RepID=A0AAD7L4G8_QUISA|nr:transcription factor 25 [Quillaja saponaria]